MILGAGPDSINLYGLIGQQSLDSYNVRSLGDSRSLRPAPNQTCMANSSQDGLKYPQAKEAIELAMPVAHATGRWFEERAHYKPDSNG